MFTIATTLNYHSIEYILLITFIVLPLLIGRYSISSNFLYLLVLNLFYASAPMQIVAFYHPFFFAANS